MGSLRYLGATDNNLPVVPESLGRLRELVELRLYGNQLTVLPDSYGELSSLRELHLDRNPLAGVPGRSTS